MVEVSPALKQFPRRGLVHSFRPEVEGLRAVAVLAVVLYHFNPAWMPGGFVGVDIFFVISGFVITRSLMNDNADGRLHLLRFYDRRIRRIFPALLAMIAVVLVAAWWLLPPGDYEAAARSGVFAAGSAANIFFWLNTGYFDAGAETMPLLHTWSLGVEEQFYIVWPLIIWAVTRFVRRASLTATILLTLGAISLALCVFLTGVDQKAAFYLAPMRAWEFCFGAVICFLPRFAPRVHQVAGLTGAAIIGATLAFATNAIPFPGWLALLPVLGSALLIAGGEATLAGRFLSLPPVRFFGRISYSLYLWHWPVLVCWAYYATPGERSLMETVVLLAVILALSCVSFFLIETPARRASWPPVRMVAAGLIAALLVAIPAFAVATAGGIPERIPEAVRPLGELRAMSTWNCDLLPSKVGTRPRDFCILGDPWGDTLVHGLLWGDSHAQHLAPIVDAALKGSGQSYLLWTDRCPPFLDDETVKRWYPSEPSFSADCAYARYRLGTWLAGHSDVDRIVMAGAWSGFALQLYTGDDLSTVGDDKAGFSLMRAGLLAMMSSFAEIGRRVAVIGEIPRPGFDVPACALRNGGGLLREPCARRMDILPVPSAQSGVGLANAMLESVAVETGVPLLIPARTFCSSAGCPLQLNGEVLYRDGNHLRLDLQPATRKMIADRLGLRSFLLGP